MKNVKHNVLKERVNEKLGNHQRHHILWAKVKRILNRILKIFFFFGGDVEHKHVRLITERCRVIMLVFSFTHYKYDCIMRGLMCFPPRAKRFPALQ